MAQHRNQRRLYGLRSRLNGLFLCAQDDEPRYFSGFGPDVLLLELAEAHKQALRDDRLSVVQLDIKISKPEHAPA